MTSLTVLGSGSRGNACALRVDGAVLLLDAGFSPKEILKRAERAGVDIGELCGIALTHEHGDHARGAIGLAKKHRVPVLTSPGTWSALGAPSSVPYVPVRSTALTECGPFTVTGCPLLHDAAEPLALTVTTTSGVQVGVAYDFGRPTQALRYQFRDLDAVILEANYDEVLLRMSDYPVSVQHRIAGSGGHLSNRASAQLLEELYHPGLGTIVLAHLSQRCNTPDAARAAIEPVMRAIGFRGEVAVARQDAPLPALTLRRGERADDQGSLFATADPDREEPEPPLVAGWRDRRASG